MTLYYIKPTSRPCRRVMQHLRDHGTSTVSEISEAVNVSVQAVAGAVRCVVVHGYVTTTGRRTASQLGGIRGAKPWAPALLTLTPAGLVALEAALVDPPKVRDTWHERRGDREAVMRVHQHAIRRAMLELGDDATRLKIQKTSGLSATAMQHALPALVKSGHVTRTFDGVRTNLYSLDPEAEWPLPPTPPLSPALKFNWPPAQTLGDSL